MIHIRALFKTIIGIAIVGLLLYIFQWLLHQDGKSVLAVILTVLAIGLYKSNLNAEKKTENPGDFTRWD